MSRAENQHLRPTLPSATLTTPPALTQPGSGKDSVALHTIRSVRSLAYIGSWAQLKHMPPLDVTTELPAPGMSELKKKKKKDKDNDQRKEKGKEKEMDKAAVALKPGCSL